ncbi:MAG: sulfotransferase [Alphaproteobacteria bacterium]
MTQQRTGRKNTPPEADFRLPAEAIATVPIPQQQKVSIEQALQLALQHQEAGRLQQAEVILKQILQVQPECAPAWHTLGLVAHNAGKTEMAAGFVEKAIAYNGKVALFHANLGEMYRLLKNPDKAVEHGRKAVALDPKLVSAHSNLGIAYFDQEEFEKAETCHRAALKLNPDFPPSLNNLGSIHRERKEDEKALEYYNRARAVSPDYLEPLNNIGATLVRMDKPEEALSALNIALIKRPNYAEAHCNKGYALLALDQIPQAMISFATALQLRADYAEAFIGIARGRREEQQLEIAEAAARRALEINPDMAEGWSVLGSVYTSQGMNEKARQAFDKALELDADNMGAKMGIGNLMLESGNLKEAEAIFRTAADTGKDHIGALFSLIQAKKVKPGDKELAALEEEGRNIAKLPESKATYIHFALGKAYDDLGEADKAFPHFIEGCRMKRKRLHYDANAKEQSFARVREVFSADFIKSHQGQGFRSDAPIFVLGMPRSGTTLTEQIIASHPDVHGAGEIFDLLDIAGSRPKPNETPFPENMLSASPKQLEDMGRRYATGLQARNPKAKKITDKMPINFLHIGLIHLILPEAKIVHVSRHPLDTCISCFTRLFAHNQDCTYDLKELGRFYRSYSDTIKHWRKVLPKNAFYDVRYEDLVEDTETQSRKLIEYCGLDWNDACMEPHKHERSIKTASVTQVRQPVYKTSVARWKKYEKFLGPLIEGLGDALDEK